MKLFDDYHKKIERATEKLLRKTVGCKSIVDALKMTRDLKIKIEKTSGKNIHEVTMDELIEHKLTHEYAKWRTLSQIMEIVSSSIILQKFIADEYEANC